MTYAAVRENTADQMTDVLHFIFRTGAKSNLVAVMQGYLRGGRMNNLHLVVGLAVTF